MDINKIFILNIKKWRKVKGFSQKDLAEKCGSAHSYIRQLESGKGNPSFAFIGKIADALQIEPYRLFYDETSKLSNTAYLKHIELIQNNLMESLTKNIKTAFDDIKNNV